MSDFDLLAGDVLDTLRGLPPLHFDALFSDVPYGLGNREPTVDELVAYLQGDDLDMGGDFMGADWQVPSVRVWREVYRVLKPGAPLLVFAGSKTQDLISIGMRAAGFEVRDAVLWIQGQGFPKNLDVERAVAMDTCTQEGRHYASTLPEGKKARPKGSRTTPGPIATRFRSACAQPRIGS